MSTDFNTTTIPDSAATLEKDGDGYTVMNMGPQHPSTHGVLRLILTLDGERVIKCVPDIGYLHTGIEKTAEVKTYQQALTITDRMDYLAPLSNNLGYSLATERLLGIEIPERVSHIRVLLVELQRVASHMVWLGTSGLDAGAMSMFLYCFQEREHILDLFEALSGVRMMTSYIQPGGLMADLNPGFLDKTKVVLDRLDEKNSHVLWSLGEKSYLDSENQGHRFVDPRGRSGLLYYWTGGESQRGGLGSPSGSTLFCLSRL